MSIIIIAVIYVEVTTSTNNVDILLMGWVIPFPVRNKMHTLPVGFLSLK
jgi:hypothetical protein